MFRDSVFKYSESVEVIGLIEALDKFKISPATQLIISSIRTHLVLKRLKKLVKAMDFLSSKSLWDLRIQNIKDAESGHVDAIMDLNNPTSEPRILEGEMDLQNKEGKKGDFKMSEKDQEEVEREKDTDKALRATLQQVFDPITQSVLLFLKKEKYLSQINGCISRGKEGSVYHAFTKENYSVQRGSTTTKNVVKLKHWAVKVYFTSVLQFKNRKKYSFEGFKKGGECKKSNPRTMIENWASREYGNLLTLHKAGLPVPKPVILRSNVLVMEYIGIKDLPAPKLQEVDISTTKARKLYMDCVKYLWIMYRDCHLVHGDLSEYNMLYHNEKAYIIDVSQSVSPKHPNAHEFLAKDCSNITDFFRKKGVPTLTLEELFDYIVDPIVTKTNRQKRLDKLEKAASERLSLETSHRIRIEDELFRDVYISQSLSQIVDYDRYIAPATGEQIAAESDDDDDETEDNEESESSKEISKKNSKLDRRPQGRPKKETSEEKKNRKKLFKEAAVKRRQTSWNDNEFNIKKI